jgi:hypothetical protein
VSRSGWGPLKEYRHILARTGVAPTTAATMTFAYKRLRRRGSRFLTSKSLRASHCSLHRTSAPHIHGGSSQSPDKVPWRKGKRPVGSRLRLRANRMENDKQNGE